MARLLIVCHPEDPFEDNAYLAHAMIPYWRRAGIQVQVQRGWRQRPPADLVLPHVDLSVLPQSMQRFMAHYPNVINRRVIDIRKRSISANLLARGDRWGGPVIVKTDANYAGHPEREHTMRAGLAARIHRALRDRLVPRRAAHDGQYEVFPSLDDVPRSVWRDRSLVVERFLPEREGPRYVIRHFIRLGNATCVRRMWAGNPLVHAGIGDMGEQLDEHPPPPEIVAAADRLGLDYGKIDYTIHAGRPVMIDVARTPAPPTLLGYTEIVASLAAGLGSLLERRDSPAACGRPVQAV